MKAGPTYTLHHNSVASLRYCVQAGDLHDATNNGLVCGQSLKVVCLDDFKDKLALMHKNEAGLKLSDNTVCLF